MRRSKPPHLASVFFKSFLFSFVIDMRAGFEIRNQHSFDNCFHNKINK